MASLREIQREIERGVRAAAEVKVKSKDFAEQIRDEIRAETPVDTGRAAASVVMEKRKDRNGLPSWWIGSRLSYFHFLEKGTGADKAGSKSPFGPDTPTPEFAPFAKVVHRHGGTLGDGLDLEA